MTLWFRASAFAICRRCRLASAKRPDTVCEPCRQAIDARRADPAADPRLAAQLEAARAFLAGDFDEEPEP